MIQIPKIKERIMSRTLKRLVISTNSQKEQLQQNKFFQLADLQTVDEILNLKKFDQKIHKFNKTDK